MLARDIMTENVVTIEPEASVEEAAKILSENNVSGLPVVEENKLVGIISETDLIIKDKKLHFPDYINLLGGIIYLESHKKFEKEFKKYIAVKVKELMTEEVKTINPDTSEEDIATIMVEENINRLPVVDEEGNLLGIVTRADLLKNLAEKK